MLIPSGDPVAFWRDFENWCLVDAGKAPATVAVNMERLRLMERRGVRWDVFFRSPDLARHAVSPFLADVARRGKRSAHRNYCKSLNWLATYAAQHDPAFRDLKWKLPRAPRRQPSSFTPDEISRLMAVPARDPRVAARQRCLMWFILNTGLRRGEIASLRLRDLDRGNARLDLVQPRKEGARRYVPLPANAWNDGQPLGDWLRIRPATTDGSDALWVTCRGRSHVAMKGSSLYNDDLARIGEAAGVRVSFVKARHTRGRQLTRAGVPLQVIASVFGHADPKTTMIYASPTWEDAVEAFQKAGVNGFLPENESQPAGASVVRT